MMAAEPFSSAVWRGQVLHGCLRCEEADGGAGVGLRAARAFARGDVLYRCRPSVFYQSAWSRRAAPACAHCGALVGGGLGALVALAAAATEAEDAVTWPDDGPALSDPNFALPEPLPCGCGAVFCSEACRAEQLQRGHHRIVCADLPEAQRSSWRSFYEHADRCSETFALAGLLVAQAAGDVAHGGATAEATLQRLASFAAAPWPELVDHHCAQREWWVKRRAGRLEESRELLVAAIAESLPPGLEVLTSREGYAQLVGMLDITTKCLERPNPLNPRLRAALEEGPLPARTVVGKFTLDWIRARNAATDAQENVSPDVSDDEDEAKPAAQERRTVDLVGLSRRAARLPVLPGFEGFGLVDAVALTNHSCAPNVEVVASVYNADVVATALRDIAEGDEVLMSYVDESEPFRTRQRLLRSGYAFECRCKKCEEDRAAAPPP